MEEVLRRGPSSEAFRQVVYDVGTAAHDQIITARAHGKGVPKSAIPALLQSVCRYFTDFGSISFDLKQPYVDTM